MKTLTEILEVLGMGEQMRGAVFTRIKKTYMIKGTLQVNPKIGKSCIYFTDEQVKAICFKETLFQESKSNRNKPQYVINHDKGLYHKILF